MIMYVVGLLVTFFCSLRMSAQDSAWAIPPGILGSGAIDFLFIAKSALFIGIILLWIIFAGSYLKNFLKFRRSQDK